LILYLDSSALVKRYVLEPGSRGLAQRLAKASVKATSRVSLAEVAAAVARRTVLGDLSEKERDRILQRLEADFDAMVVLDVTAELVRPIPRLVRTNSLRGFDAIHLASAQVLAGEEPGSVTFASADLRLNAAASRCGFDVWDPSDP